MIRESGKVIAIEPGSLWVETIQLSGCASCSAKQGCGTTLLAKAGHHNVGHIRALLTDQLSSDFSLGDHVEIGIEENIIAGGALFVYLLPLAGLLLGAMLGDAIYLNVELDRDLTSVMMGLVGLLFGGGLVRAHAYLYRNSQKFQPVILSAAGSQPQPVTVVPFKEDESTTLLSV